MLPPTANLTLLCASFFTHPLYCASSALLHKTMPKRTSIAEDETKDPPEVIRQRRIVKVSGRFRRANASSGVDTASSPSALFGGTAVDAPGPGQANASPGVNTASSLSALFGGTAADATGVGQVNASSGVNTASSPSVLFGGTAADAAGAGCVFGNAFSLGANGPTSSSSANTRSLFGTGVIGTGPTPGGSSAAPTRSLFSASAPFSATSAIPTPPVPGATAGISFLNYGPPSGDDAKPTFDSSTIPPSTTNGKSTPVVGAEQQRSGFGAPSVATDFSLKPAAIVVEANAVGQPASRRHADSENPSPSTRSGPPFGRGPTAGQGIRLNKMFASWISHQIETNSASTLDVGLLDYVTYAAGIRNRAELSRVDFTSPAGTAFKHSLAPSAFTPAAASDPVPPVASTVAAIPRVAPLAPAPAPAPTPAPAPPRASVVNSTPAFSFSAPSTLPAAPGGVLFPFAAPSVSTSTTPSATPAIIAPSTSSPTREFKFGSGVFGGGVTASPPPFNGFQVPAGGAVAPPAPAAADSEEDGMPKEDPSKLERAPGEENEEIMGTFRAKLYRFKKDEMGWGDMGVGLLRLMKHTATDARRLVLRNDMGKVLLNTALYKGMTVTKTKNSIKFVANVAGDGPTSIMIKVTAAQLPELHAKVQELLPSS